MVQRTREQKLFGAACVRVTLERGGPDVSSNEIYRGTLKDLGLTDDEVLHYLETHRDDVVLKLKAGRRMSEEEKN